VSDKRPNTFLGLLQEFLLA